MDLESAGRCLGRSFPLATWIYVGSSDLLTSSCCWPGINRQFSLSLFVFVPSDTILHFFEYGLQMLSHCSLFSAVKETHHMRLITPPLLVQVPHFLQNCYSQVRINPAGLHPTRYVSISGLLVSQHAAIAGRDGESCHAFHGYSINRHFWTHCCSHPRNFLFVGVVFSFLPHDLVGIGPDGPFPKRGGFAQDIKRLRTGLRWTPNNAR